MRRLPHLLFIGLLAACEDKGTTPFDTGLELGDPFCETYGEANSSLLTEEPIDGPSGLISGTLVQGVVTDPHDPQYVAFVDYLLENLDVGGQPTVGRTNAEGRFTATLGPGNWRTVLSSSKSAATKSSRSISATRACSGFGRRKRCASR